MILFNQAPHRIIISYYYFINIIVKKMLTWDFLLLLIQLESQLFSRRIMAGKPASWALTLWFL